MVWWINKIFNLKSYDEINKDIIIASTSFMFNCRFGKSRLIALKLTAFGIDKDLTANEIYSLWGCGIQIFNVDRTIHDETYFLNVKNAIKEFQEMQNRPCALSITMSLNDPVECDENVDIIILKDAMKRQDVIEFKKQRAKIVPNTPILLWIAELYIEDMDRLISVVDGVIVDSVNEEEIERRNLDFCPSALKICKEAHKPIFLYNANIVEEYAGNQRRDILPFAQKVYNNRLDGIVLEDPKKKSSEVIQSLFTAICYLENILGSAKDCIEFSKQLKIPILPNLSVSVSACIAASKSKASAIILLTASGRSARWVACARPPCPVLAITTRASTARWIHIYGKVIPVLYTEPRATDWRKEWENRVTFGTMFALKFGLFGYGAKLVVLAPSEEGIGYCNSFQIVSVPYKCHYKFE